MTERVKKAIDIFLDAINNGTLAKGTCRACACANLVAAELGVKCVLPESRQVRESENITEEMHWFRAIKYYVPNRKEMITYHLDLEKGIETIHKTGFTVAEFKKIERAFESNTRFNYLDYTYQKPEAIRADQINGLKAVVAVMLTFDDCKESIEEVFTQKAELIPIN